MEFESKLIPILREGIDIIKMVFFRKLQTYLSEKYPERETSYTNNLAGAIINELFGSTPLDRRFTEFAKENAFLIEREMDQLSINFDEMRIPLTDALRVQFLCDHQEGIDSTPVLSKAKDIGILILERDVPLPAQFMNLVRKLGSAFGILAPS